MSIQHTENPSSCQPITSDASKLVTCSQSSTDQKCLHGDSSTPEDHLSSFDDSFVRTSVNSSKNISSEGEGIEGSNGHIPAPNEPSFPSENCSENDVYFLIHGNNSSDVHKQGLHGLSDEIIGDTSDKSFFDRLKRYATAHVRAVDMAKFIRSKFTDTSSHPFKDYSRNARVIANQLDDCGSYLVFRHFYTINEMKLSSMCSCKRHLLCPLCAIRRAAKTIQVYLEKNNFLCDSNPHLVPYLVTFTVKDGEDLQERFDHLQKSLRKYYAHRRKFISSPKRNKSNESNKALAGVGSYEIKIGSGSGQWHPHSHYIWLCESPPDVAVIRQEWQEITSDSFMVDVTPFYDRKNVSDGFLEVFKYALKYSSMTLAHNWEAYEALQGRRLVSSFGLFHGLEIPEQLTDEITYDELPYFELVYRFFTGEYKLVGKLDQQGNERSE